jgi:hypothetical protein
MRLAHEFQHGGDLLADLGDRAEGVRVVEPDRADPGQAAEHPGTLGAVHAAELGDPQRQITVRPLPRLEDQRVVRTQAGPQHQVVAEVHGREHVVGEVAPVPGQFVHLAFAQHGGVDVLVAGAPLEFTQVGLHLVARGGAGRQPERQAGADQRVGVEDVELAAEPAVVDAHESASWSGGRHPPGTTEAAPGRCPGPLRRWDQISAMLRRDIPASSSPR